MIAFVNSTTSIVEVLNKDTYNHELTLSSTLYKKLRPDLYNYIKCSLTSGISPQHIRDTFLKDVGILNTILKPFIPKVEHFISLRQSKRIRSDLKKENTVTHSDATAVCLKVHDSIDELQNRTPFIVHKPQGGKTEFALKGLDQLPFSNRLFALVIQTKEQLDVMIEGTCVYYVQIQLITPMRMVFI